MKHKKVLLNSELKINKEDRTIEAIGSNNAIDRDNEIMTNDGWDLKNFRKNPVILFAHNSHELPIAKATSVKMDKEKGLLFKIKFPDEGVHGFSDTVFKMYQDGFLNAFSVGFIGKEAVVPQDRSKPVEITKKELLELSAVPVPANPQATQLNAIKTALDKGAINEQEAGIAQASAKDYFKEISENVEMKSFLEDTEIKDETPTPEPPAVEPETPEEKPIEKSIYDRLLSVVPSKSPEKGASLDDKTVESIKGLTSFKNSKEDN